MKTTDEVIEAVRTGAPATDEELRYAVRNLSVWQNNVILPLAGAIAEDPISAKTKRDLQRAFDRAKSSNSVPLDQWLKGTSFEPGISRDKQIERWVSSTAEAAVKLAQALSQQERR